MYYFKKSHKTEETIKKDKDVWYFMQQRIINQKHLKNQRISKNFMSYSLIGLVIILFGTFGFYLFQDYKIEKNGVETKAKIDLVKRNSYRANDMDPQWIENYLIWYTFKTKKKTIRGYQQILLEDYHSYFDYEIKNLDSINIMYNSKSPNENKICKNGQVKRMSTTPIK
ncbi:MAG: hypothetical protein HRT69_14280 [Flavobacteriaceae bacterium]|nr:hypothetical protein [Flavobacteriaceae bacterium]